MIDDSALLHAKVYDPVKAREYYLRTRKLKGRKPGAAKELKGRSGTRVDPGVKRRRQRQAELKAKKEALEKRLDRLREILKEKVALAKKRSGPANAKKQSASAPSKSSSSSKTSSGKSGSSKSKDRKPETPSQKRERAKKAKEAYEKEHPNSLSEDIEILREQIKDIQAKIKKAIQDAQGKPPSSSKAGKQNLKSGSKNRQRSGPKGR